jgi:hypothetical protein
MKSNAGHDDLREMQLRVGRRSFGRRRSCYLHLGGMFYASFLSAVLLLLLLLVRSPSAAGAHAVLSPSAARALSSSASSADTIQAFSSSFELMLIPDSAQASEASNDSRSWSGGNNHRRRGGYSLKKETSELLQNAIASTILNSGRCDPQDASTGSEAYNATGNGTGRRSSCPYQAMVVTIERAEWTRPEDPLTIRFYIVATVRSDQDYDQKRSQSSSFDLRQELDAFVLDFFYGDLFLSTVLEGWSDDQDEDEVLTRAMISNVELQVSESQGRIYQTRSPTASVVFLAVAFVMGLFVLDGAVRYATPVHLCASRRPMSESDDASGAVERETLTSERTRELV